MKKFIATALILVSIATTFCANAQEATWAEKRHQLSFSVGTCSVYQVFESIITGVVSGMTKNDIESMDGFGTINVGYLYNLNKHFAVGADATYEHFSAKYKDPGASVSTLNHYTVMPAVRAYWFNKTYVSMYSKLAVGGTLITSDDGEEITTSGCFAAQLSPVAIEVGNNKLRGFAEIGIGMQGLILGGVRYSF